MKTTINICRQFFLLLFFSVAIACSSNDESSTAKDQASKDNFMQEKLDTIKKAEAVNQLIQDTATKQNLDIDDQSR